MAFGALLIHRLLGLSPFGIPVVVVYTLAHINITLAALNLIPIPPLDGSKILMGFVPAETRYFLARIEPYGFFIMIGLLFLGLLNPFINLFRSIIIALIGVLLP